MRKCNTKFHSKRSSGRAVREGDTTSDYCAFAHAITNDKRMQLACNSLLTGLLNRVGVFG